MGMLDHGSTSSYGHPKPTTVLTSPVKGNCIAVSGHDLKGECRCRGADPRLVAVVCSW